MQTRSTSEAVRRGFRHLSEAPHLGAGEARALRASLVAFNERLRQDPFDLEALRGRSLALMQRSKGNPSAPQAKKDLRQAEADLDDILMRNDQRVFDRQSRGQVRMFRVQQAGVPVREQKRLVRGAIEDLRVIAGHYPKVAYVHEELGCAWFLLSDMLRDRKHIREARLQAAQQLSAALALDPGDEYVRAEIVLLRHALRWDERPRGRVSAAWIEFDLAELERALQKTPDFGRLRLTLGLSYSGLARARMREGVSPQEAARSAARTLRTLEDHPQESIELLEELAESLEDAPDRVRGEPGFEEVRAEIQSAIEAIRKSI